MKKLLLSVVAAATAMFASATTVVDFTTADNLPASDAEDAVATATISGVNFSFLHCKKGVYQDDAYLQVSGKNYSGQAYVEFVAAEKVGVITVKTGKSASTNVTVQMSVNGAEVGEAVKLSAQNADFNFAIPAANQAENATIRLTVTNKYNAQIQTLTIGGEAAVDPEPTPDPESVKVANIAALVAANAGLEQGDSEAIYELTGAVTAIYQNGVNLYVKDNTGYMLLYGSVANTYANGDVIPAGITGKFSMYNGLPELKVNAESVAAGTAGTAVAPVVTTLDDFNAEGKNAYVTLKGVSIKDVNGKNFTIYDPNAEAAGYNTFGLEIGNGENLDITGFIGYYNNYQIIPTEIKGNMGGEDPEPETPVGCKYFNFSEPATLTPAYPATKDGEGLTADGTAGNMQAIVTGVDFTVDNVTIANTKGNSTDAKIYYQSGGAIQLRVYNGGSTTIKTTNGDNIEKIVFKYNNGKTSYDKVTAPEVGSWEAGTWTGSAKEVTFAYTGTQQINAVEVYTATSGVEAVAAEDAQAPVEYYNLQGVRVANPESGLYIRRQGNSVSKVVIR